METMRRMLDPLHRKLRLLAGRAVLSLLSDAVTVQIKALDGEVRDEAELFQQYGFRSRPRKGAEGIMLSLGGNRDHTIVICMDDRRYQLDLLQDGEAAMYTDEGDYFCLKRGNLAELNTRQFVVKASAGVRFETPALDVTGQVKDLCDATGTTMADMRDVYNGHEHEDPQGGHVSGPSREM